MSDEIKKMIKDLTRVKTTIGPELQKLLDEMKALEQLLNSKNNLKT